MLLKKIQAKKKTAPAQLPDVPPQRPAASHIGRNELTGDVRPHLAPAEVRHARARGDDEAVMRHGQESGVATKREEKDELEAWQADLELRESGRRRSGQAHLSTGAPPSQSDVTSRFGAHLVGRGGRSRPRKRRRLHRRRTCTTCATAGLLAGTTGPGSLAAKPRQATRRHVFPAAESERPGRGCQPCGPPPSPWASSPSMVDSSVRAQLGR